MKKEESVLSELFRAMIHISPMGIVVWELRDGEWVLSYANANAAQFISLDQSSESICFAQPWVNNLGQVDLITLFHQVLNTQKMQEAVVKHSVVHRRAQVFLIPLGGNYVISYYMNIDPFLRKENELKSTIHQLAQFNANMFGREDELDDLERKMKALKLKLKLITTNKSLSYGK